MCVSPQHLSYGNDSLHVDAAFQQTLWSVAPICSGSEVAQGTTSFLYPLHVSLLLCLCFLSFMPIFVLRVSPTEFTEQGARLPATLIPTRNQEEMINPFVKGNVP